MYVFETRKSSFLDVAFVTESKLYLLFLKHHKLCKLWQSRPLFEMHNFRITHSWYHQNNKKRVTKLTNVVKTTNSSWDIKLVKRT